MFEIEIRTDKTKKIKYFKNPRNINAERLYSKSNSKSVSRVFPTTTTEMSCRISLAGGY